MGASETGVRGITIAPPRSGVHTMTGLQHGPLHGDELHGERRHVQVPIGAVTVDATLLVPEHARATIVVADGDRGRYGIHADPVVAALSTAHLAVLCVELRVPDEPRRPDVRADLSTLTERLIAVTYWLRGQKGVRHARVGYLGLGTGAAVALEAAAALSRDVGAVVSGAGRPDLAVHLEHVTAPTLLVVGALDPALIAANELAFEGLSCEKALAVLPGASGTLEAPADVDRLLSRATQWFGEHLWRAS
jgi:putative phosphoribosyl transferase